MNWLFKKIGLVARQSKPEVVESLLLLSHHLESQGLHVFIDRDSVTRSQAQGLTLIDRSDFGKIVDVAIVLGGDGTMLSVARLLAPYRVPLIGINQGRLGFITDIPLKDYATLLPPMLQGHYQTDLRSLMHARVQRDDHYVFDALAMNDVVVYRGGTAGMMEMRVEVDGHFVANQRADGLIIATPTGSTAYSLSVGGSLMHPGIGGWIMAPIAPHTLSNRPIVLPDNCEVGIEIVSGRYASANFDMQSLASLAIGDRITVRRSQHQVRFLHPEGWNYFDTLRKKMHWNEGA